MKNLSTKHDSHEVMIHPGHGPHFRSLRCDECKAFIMHLGRDQYDTLIQMDIPEMFHVTVDVNKLLGLE